MGDMTVGQLFVAMGVSVVGVVLFRFGKKERRGPQLVGGVVLMVAPLLVQQVLLSLLLAGAVGAGVWWASRNGW
jgi:hypothetical protein